MSSRPRRSAAQKASVAITDMADRDSSNMSSSRSRRAGDGKALASVSRGGQDDKDHTYLTVKLPTNKLRQATTSRNGSSISVSSESAPKRPTRGNKKSYVVDDSDEDEDDDEGEDEIQVGAPVGNAGDEEEEDEADSPDEDDEDVEDADADEMDVDAEGEEDDEDAEGEEDYEMTPAQPPPAIKISKPVKTSPSSRKKTKQITPKKAAGQSAADGGNNSDDDELSDLDSDDEVMNLGDEDAEGEDDEEDMDAEGEEIEEDQDAEGEPEPDIAASSKPGEVDSDDEGSDGEAPDLSRMTQRQRARFEGLDESHYQALSNEVQAKKHFTVEEKAMRRAEMARRRRNLSEKRNEEVKQETINKLLKKQAGKTNRKGLSAIGEEQLDEDDVRKPNPIFIRYTSTLRGNTVSVPEEIMEGPFGRLFINPVRPAAGFRPGPRKMVEEVEEIA